jgi:prolyl-tRNA synthetase
MGTIVEVSHDDRGIIWPKSVSPYDVHLVGLHENAEKVYKNLEDAGVEVLYDDRNEGAGQKFADCDLIGIPVRLVVSEKTGDNVEYKKRDSEETELFSLEEVGSFG